MSIETLDVARKLKMEKFKHFIQTKFNVPTREGPPSDEWMESRFEIFDSITVPSIKNQQNQNFEWLVFFRSDTKKHWLEKIETYGKTFTPVFVNNLREVKLHLSSIERNFEYLITTRFDNDDALARHYIKDIQKNFEETDFLIFNFLNGARVQYPTYKIQRMVHNRNPFISMLEKSIEGKAFQTAAGTHHGRIYDYGRVKQLNTPIAWLIVIHKNNISNRLGAEGLVDEKAMLQKGFAYLKENKC